MLVYLSGGSIVWLLVYLIFVCVSSTEPSGSNVTSALGGAWRACGRVGGWGRPDGGLSALQCDGGFNPLGPWAPDLHLRRGH